MRYSRIFRTMRMLAAAAIAAAALNASPARAAATVDITYDLSDSTIVWDAFSNKLPVGDADFSVNGTVSGAMTVRYTSNSSTSMPVLSGSAALLAFDLTAKSLSLQKAFNYPAGAPGSAPAYLTGTLHWQLQSTATGNLGSNGLLTGINAGLLMTGRANCVRNSTGSCSFLVGLPTFTVFPSYVRSGAINVAGAATGSAPHTLTGRAPAVGWQPGAGILALGADFWPYDNYGGVHLVGREIIRAADGHPTRVIPEPGTLLLLGAGTVGLALVGRATRRSRQG